MTNRKVFCSLIFGLAVLTGSLDAQYYIAPYEKVNCDLLYLQTAGYLRDMDLYQTPLSTIQIAHSLQADSGNLANLDSRSVIRSLTDRIESFYTFPNSISRNEELHLIYGVKLTLDHRSKVKLQKDQNQPQSKLYPQLRTFGSLTVAKNLSVTNVMTLDPYATENPQYLGKEWRGLSGYTEQAYLMWSARYMRLTAGRSYIGYGPGRKSSLLFSSTARPMDNLKVDIFRKHFGFQGVTAKLDPINGYQRYLSAHRLSFYFGNWAVGMTEAVLYSGTGKNLEYAYLNPFLFYHGEQMNGPDLNGNTLGTLDLNYCGRNWMAYTEVLVDDIQFDKKEVGDLEPNEIGCIVGFDIADPFKIPGVYIGTEYTAITNRTYKTTEESEWFLHRNEPIGYELGSDLDRFSVTARKYYKNWQFALEFDRVRQGEGELSKAWDSPWDSCTVAEGYSEKFPTGVVEITNDLGLTAAWMPDYGKYIFARLTYETIENVDHGDQDQKGLIVSVGLFFEFRK